MASATPHELSAPTCLHAALGGDVSVSITSNGVYLSHEGLGTGESDGGVWLMSHASPNGDVTMDDPWTPAVGGSEPFPERASAGWTTAVERLAGRPWQRSPIESSL